MCSTYPSTAIMVKSQVFKKQHRVNPQPAFNAFVSGDSNYETIDNEYQTIQEPTQEYSVPTSSNVVRYNPKTDEVQLPKRKDEVPYHAQGPDAGHQYDYCGSQYQEVEANCTDNREILAQYEEVPSHRVSKYQ